MRDEDGPTLRRKLRKRALEIESLDPASFQYGGFSLFDLGVPLLCGLGGRANDFHVLRAVALHEISSRHHHLRVQGAHDGVVDLRSAHDVERGSGLTIRMRKRGGTNQNNDRIA